MHMPTLALTLLLALPGCGGSSSSPAPPPPSPSFEVHTLNSELSDPWSLAFLPDGRLLITERGGALALLSADGGTRLASISGLPVVVASGQGGLLDVAVDPQFADNGLIYWSYAEAGSGEQSDLTGTAVARGRLEGTGLQEVQVIYRQTPKVSGSGHFGSRLAFRDDGTLFVTLGERQQGSPAQDLMTTLGKVVRIARDGSVPGGNPTLGGRPEIWSYGHRNPQGAAIHPVSGDLWLTEHGPQGGDELNHVHSGGNYGWPLRSYGCNYGDPPGESCQLGGGAHAPGYIEPVSTWVPTSVAPAGLLFYTGSVFPEWQGQVFFGALAGTALWRVRLNDDSEVERERLLGDLGERIRDVRQGPDGRIWLLTDSGRLLRLERVAAAPETGNAEPTRPTSRAGRPAIQATGHHSLQP